jgi:hypothetical protein
MATHLVLDPAHTPAHRAGAVPVDLAQLRRFQWAVRAALTIGVAASVSANVLHANDNPIAQAIAAWPPLALLLTVELVSRVPVHRRALAVVRIAATALIAGIAAFVSYWHMAAVAAWYGETGAAPYLLPLSVDGLIIVASVSLVELSGRIRTAERPPPPSQAFMESKAPDTDTLPSSLSVRIPSRSRPADATGTATMRPDVTFAGTAMSWPIGKSTPTNCAGPNGNPPNGTTLNGTAFNGVKPGEPNGAEATPQDGSPTRRERHHHDEHRDGHRDQLPADPTSRHADTEPRATPAQQTTVDPPANRDDGRITGASGSGRDGGDAVSDRTNNSSRARPGDARAVAEGGERDFADPPTNDGDSRDGTGDGADSAATTRGGRRQLEHIPEEVTVLLPAARIARRRLIGRNQTVNRDTLAAQLRQDGHTVGNARAGVLLNLLKREPSGGSDGG